MQPFTLRLTGRAGALMSAVALLFACGCDGMSGDSSLEAKQEASHVEADVQPLDTTPSQTAIGIYSERGSVRVGDVPEQARKVFPEPSRNAYQIRDLPERFGKEFSAQGWETASGEGFGMILYKDAVVSAMYQAERVTESQLRDTVALLRENTRDLYPVTLVGKSARYWFWSTPQDKQRLMVCAASGATGTHMTVAMGDSNIMDALGVSIAKAKSDQTRVDGGIAPVIRDESPTSPTSGERSTPETR